MLDLFSEPYIHWTSSVFRWIWYSDSYCIQILIVVVLYVAVNSIIHEFCDDHLIQQVNTSTGRNQLPVFQCTNVHLRRNTRPLFRRAVLDVTMSQSELTTISFNSFYQPDLPKQNPRLQDWDSWEPPRLLCPRVEFENFDKNLEASSDECLESERRWRQSELWGRQHGARLPGKIPWK